jgi:hypothetical protein
MKNFLAIDVDTTRKDKIMIMKDPGRPLSDWPDNPVLADFASILESAVTLIRVLDQEKVQTASESLRKAIKHLEDGFASTDIEVVCPQKEE